MKQTLVAAFLAVLNVLPCLAIDHTKPNIVVILADDLGYGDLPSYNPKSKVKTPHLDQLVKQGIRLTDAHSPSTVCTPTRYGLMTGQMPFRVPNGGAVFTGAGGPSLIEKGRLTLPAMLKGQGYSTAAIGKWHIGLTFRDKDNQPIHHGSLESVQKIDYSKRIEGGPLEHGFDRFFGTACCPTTDWLYAFIDGDRIPVPPTDRIDKSNLPKHPYANDCRSGMIAHDFPMEDIDLVFLKKSREFLAEHARTSPGKPFFLYHAAQAVHLPSFPAKQFQGRSNAGPHGDFIEQFDFIVGELLNDLNRLGLADNTIVIVTSDNGPEVTSVVHMRTDHQHDPAAPLRGMKRDCWEGGHRVPFIVRWPGHVPANSTSNQLLCLTDIMATCAAITGATLPANAGEDSFNMKPVFEGVAKEPVRPYLLTQAARGVKALSIRRGDWKYISHNDSGGNNYANNQLSPWAIVNTAPKAPGQLYDLKSDPGETINLYEQKPEIVSELNALLDKSKADGRSRPVSSKSSNQLTIDRIFGSREFDAQSVPAFHWADRQSHYDSLEKPESGPGRDLVRHDPVTGKKTIIIPANRFIPKNEKEPLNVDSFSYSPNQMLLLIFTKSQRVWRQNTRGDYWLLNAHTQELTKLGGDGPASSMMYAKFSPDGSRVAFVRSNNVFVQDVKTLAITPITADGNDTIINGTGDWVNEEELELRDCIRWSTDGKQVLFWQFDTTGVPLFHMVNNVVSKTPRLTTFAYPKVGEKNSATRLGVASAAGGPVRWIDLPGDPREHYIPHAEWSPDGQQILVQQFNRLQTDLHIFLANPQDGKARKVFTETDAAWLENDNPVRWLDGGKSLLWLSERTGWRHAYRAKLDGSPLEPITKGDFDIIDIDAIDQKNGWLYYSASPTNATQRYLYRIKFDGTNSERISPQTQHGSHTYDISPDAEIAIHRFSNFQTPPVITLINLKDHSTIRILADNQKLKDLLKTIESPTIEFFKVPVGKYQLDGWSMKPASIKPGSKLPLVMHVYGEPHGQTVKDAWPGSQGLWHMMLAQQGYVVASVDNRGVKSPRGREWRKCVHKQIGTLASNDQAAAVRELVNRWPFVDRTRVASWGWSGGGSMSLNAIFRYPDLYRTAIAIAPVADQLLYDSIYQERYMGLPTENAAGYREGSPLTHAKQLRGNLLIIHGTGDDNCHYQGTERLLDELIARSKRFTVLPYPNRSHSISEGKNIQRHLWQSITQYLHDHLKAEHAPAPESIYHNEQLQGWTLSIHREVLAIPEWKRTRELLEKQLQEIIRVVPRTAVAELQKVPLYFNPEYDGIAPRAEYHSSAEWLRSQGRDPAMARCVEFSNVRSFEREMNRMPNVTLHELAHAYHAQFLPQGFQNEAIRTQFTKVKAKKIYDRVERHFGNGKPNTFEKAYAITSPMEYFAETTEAYFSRNDFFPFTRAELKTHDPAMIEILETLWQVPKQASPLPSPSAPDSLTQQLLKESKSDLAKAAREKGDANRGAVLFFQPFMTCAKCHDSETGTQLGPDLSKAGKEATAEYLVESILAPSAVIKKGYEPLNITLTDGRTVTGLLVEEKNGQLTLMDPAGGKKFTLPIAEIESRTQGQTSLMPEGMANLLSDRQQFLDLIKYLIEITEGGPAKAKELRPAQATYVLPEYEKLIDHAGLIKSWDDKSLKRGEAIYNRICANCHGTFDHPGSLPTSPKFAQHTFKNGNDPYNLYRTLTHGYNQMAPQTWMVPKQKYDVIHYVRETYLKKNNPSQYAAISDAYLSSLPKGNTYGPAPASVDPWMAMDYGPSLMNTYEVAASNIAYKAIAIRLDAGQGGVSRGKNWALFDHDTMRYAAAWSGNDKGNFIDWKGIHFNGQHQVHPKIVGDISIANPVGPGWANPETGSFDDPRPLGRDKKPYGPLPRNWAQFKGTFAYGDQTIISYSVGDAAILELDGIEGDSKNGQVFTRTLEIGKSSRDLMCRLSTTGGVAIVGDKRVSLISKNGHELLSVPASATPCRVKVLIDDKKADVMKLASASPAPRDLNSLTQGGPKRWPETIKSAITTGKADGPFAVDTFGIPERNPWNALIRLTGFDFVGDGKQMAVCTWDGDVWMVSGLDSQELTWRRITSGLFQPLGLKIRDGQIFICCRDQIVRLHDLNGDGEIDHHECFNNDHQVTEHFHEFAMGLQTDDQGNFYYAKSGCHAKTAVVPHHGTLLKVSRDGRKTDILATGFRAANGVCLNPDGTFFVTDQEGFWTPKNRINKVEVGGFYGNLWGYTDITDTADSAMKQPLCWITNEFDRSPAELIWVPQKTWGTLAGSLLNTSYGMGKIYVVPHETVNGQTQGGMCALPIPTLPTGIMRPRFHPTDGQLYVCGMYAWAGNQTTPGGFYRVRYTGQPVDLPVKLNAVPDGVKITMSDAIDPKSVDAKQFDVKVWGLIRSAKYGSKHQDEKSLTVKNATLSRDGKTIHLDIPNLVPTWCMEIKCRLTDAQGKAVSLTIHNTIHQVGK